MFGFAVGLLENTKGDPHIKFTQRETNLRIKKNHLEDLGR